MAHRVLVITERDFEDLELFVPRYRFEEAGCAVDVATVDGKPRTGKRGYEVKASLTLREADATRYDALHIPGGTINADKLRTQSDAARLAREFMAAGKPVFAICHAPWVLVEADALSGRAVTSAPSIRRDVENAGAQWRNAAVVVDANLVTSREIADLPQYCGAAVKLLG